MAIVQSMDKGITTLIVDLGGDRLMAVYVEKPADEVWQALANGGWVEGDSDIGAVQVPLGSVKYAQVGRRELNLAAGNRPSNLPL